MILSWAPELREMFPELVLAQVVDETGFQQREGNRDAVKFLRTMLVSASSPSGGRQADIMQQYFEAGGEWVVRGSFYDWFGPPLERAASKLSEIALDYAGRQPADLRGTLGGVRDGRIVDSATVKLHPTLRDTLPGAGVYAAVKVHKTLSLGSEGPSSTTTLVPLESVMRLTSLKGTEIELFLDDVYLSLGNVIDVDVLVSGDLRMLLVGAHAPDKRYRFYLSNLPRRFGPHEIADPLYHVRWQFEVSFSATLVFVKKTSCGP